jgi:hypothetical protein
VGPATDSLQLDLSGAMLPKGRSASVLVFDAGGNLLINEPIVDDPDSATISFGASVPSTGTALYLAIAISGPSGAPGAAGEFAYSVPVTSEAATPDGIGISPDSGGGSAGAGSDSGSSGAVVIGPSSGSGSSGPGQPGNAPTGGSAEGPWPSRTTTMGTGTPPTTFERIGAASSQRPMASIDVSPLPASRYEPAGGIFADGGVVEGADRVDATRIDISLVRLSVAVRDRSLHDEPSREPDAATPSSPGAESSVSPMLVIAGTDGSSPRGPRSSRSEGRTAVRPSRVPFAAVPFAAPVGPAAEGFVGGAPGLSAATLPPIDESDRASSPIPPPSRGEETVDSSPPERAHK